MARRRPLCAASQPPALRLACPRCSPSSQRAFAGSSHCSLLFRWLMGPRARSLLATTPSVRQRRVHGDLLPRVLPRGVVRARQQELRQALKRGGQKSAARAPAPACLAMWRLLPARWLPPAAAARSRRQHMMRGDQQRRRSNSFLVRLLYLSSISIGCGSSVPPAGGATDLAAAAPPAATKKVAACCCVTERKHEQAGGARGRDRDNPQHAPSSARLLLAR